MFKRLSDYICQRVFDKAIRAGHYKEDDYMCVAISQDRFNSLPVMWAKRCIKKYLHDLSPSTNSPTLALALCFAKLPFKPADRMAIYKDWKNRPYPEKGNNQ